MRFSLVLLGVLATLAGCSPEVEFDPVADAGDDAVVAVGAEGVLDGSASFDQDGSVAEWTWTLLSQPDGADAQPSVQGATVSLVPDTSGTWTFGLVVTDDRGNASLMDVASVHAVPANQPPVAELVATGALGLGLATTLDASASFDPEGQPLTYEFEVVLAPSSSSPELVSDGAMASFTPDRPGFYVVGVRVDDGQALSTRADVELLVGTAPNSSPTAVCGAPVQVEVGEAAQLDGSASFDPDGDALSYTWVIVEAPVDSTATLDDPTLASPTLVPDMEGAWYGRLVVDDGSLSSEPCVTTIRAGEGGPNNSPVARAGLDQSVRVGDLATVDGDASYDPDGDPLTWTWTFTSVPAGSAVDDSDLLLEISAASFVPDQPGDYTLELSVCDGEPLCDTDTVVLTANEVVNSPPIARAGPDQSVSLGQTASFDGGASSDPDGDPLSFQWTLVTAPGGSALTSADIGNAQGAIATLTPDVEGTFALELEVCDGNACDYDAALLSVGAAPNQAPIADAGADTTVNVGSSVTLDGTSSSDPDGDPLTYVWLFSSKPQGSALTWSDISDRTTATPSFTPDVAGDFVLRLTVDDGALNDTDTVTVTATGSLNTAPIADAGADLSASVGDTVTLDGSGSNDPDGDPITYSWIFFSKPSGSALTYSDISDRTTATPSFTPDVAGDYTLRLRVSDGTDTDDDTVKVTVSPGNSAPIADAGADQSGCTGPFTLDGSGSSDPDGDPLTYAWVFFSKPSGSALTYSDISDRTTATPSFDPDVAGTYVLRLTVKDGTDQDQDTVSVVVGSDARLLLHLDETSGFTASDEGSAALSVTADVDAWSAGVFFGALRFEGNALTVPDDAVVDLTSDFTIEWWMRAQPGNTSYQALFVKGGSFTSYNVFRYLDSGLYLYAPTSSGGVVAGFVSGASFDGDWHHYAITVDASNLWTVYEDGASLGTVSGSGAIATNNDDLVVGAHPTTTGYDLHAMVDELIIHDGAMTGSEVATRAGATEQFCTGDTDTTAPTLTITTTSATTDQPYVAIEGTADDDSTVVAVSVAGVDAVSTSGDFDTWVAFVPLSAGANSLSASAEDIWGNTASGGSVSMTFVDDCYDDYVLLLSFDDEGGSGVAEDYSPRTNDGVDAGTDRVIGVYGNAARFDGTDSVTVPDAGNLDLVNRFTIDFWYRSTSTSGVETLADKGDNYAVWLDGDDLYCGLVDGNGDDQVLVGLGFNDGDWHHVTCSWNLTRWRMFIDGAKEDDVGFTANPVANTDDLVLGDGWSGDLDGFRVHKGTSVALSGSNSLRTEGEVCLPSSNLGATATATASAEASANYSADRILDGDTNESDYSDQSYWLLPQGTTGSIDVDLGAVYGVTMLRWANTHHGPRYTQATADYEILVSTTGDFAGEEVSFDVGTGSMETDLLFHQVESGTPVAGRFIRITVDSYHSLGGGLNELEVYGL